MRYVEVGASSGSSTPSENVRVSVIGLGTWQFGSKDWGYGDQYAGHEAAQIVQRALDMGVNLLDTAEFYGPFVNEELIGRAVSGRRDDFVIGTKWGALPGRLDGSAPTARRSVEGSLSRLRTDRLDLVQRSHHHDRGIRPGDRRRRRGRGPKPGQAVGIDVVGEDLEALAEQVQGHRPAHVAQPDEGQLQAAASPGSGRRCVRG